jgi:hypothetical protein
MQHVTGRTAAMLASYGDKYYSDEVAIRRAIVMQYRWHSYKQAVVADVVHGRSVPSSPDEPSTELLVPHGVKPVHRLASDRRAASPPTPGSLRRSEAGRGGVQCSSGRCGSTRGQRRPSERGGGHREQTPPWGNRMSSEVKRRLSDDWGLAVDRPQLARQLARPLARPLAGPLARPLAGLPLAKPLARLPLMTAPLFTRHASTPSDRTPKAFSTPGARATTGHSVGEDKIAFEIALPSSAPLSYKRSGATTARSIGTRVAGGHAGSCRTPGGGFTGRFTARAALYSEESGGAAACAMWRGELPSLGGARISARDSMAMRECT